MVKPKYALIQWIRSEEDSRKFSVLPIQWVRDFNFNQYKSRPNESYVVEWHDTKKEPLGGWKVYDGLVLMVHEIPDMLEKMEGVLTSPRLYGYTEPNKQVCLQQKVEVYPGSGVLIDSTRLMMAKATDSPGNFVNTLLVHLFTTEVLIKSNYKGGKSKNVTAEDCRRPGLDQTIVDAIRSVEGEEGSRPLPPLKPGTRLGGGYSPPPYRMPPYPLYGESAPIPGTNTLHTHSNKFPIEREVILSSADKNTKIPILQEYRRRERNKTVATISPDGPNKVVAWTATNNTTASVHNTHLPETPLRPHQMYMTSPHLTNEPMKSHQSPYIGGPHTGAVPRTYDGLRMKQAGDHQVPMKGAQVESRSTQQEARAVQNELASLRISGDTVEEQLKQESGVQAGSEGIVQRFASELEGKQSSDAGSSIQMDTVDSKTRDGELDKNKAFPTRTYHTLKGMISSRFNKTPKDSTDTSLTKSNSSLLEAVALNNVEKDVNKTLDNSVIKDDGGKMLEEGRSGEIQGEGQYARVALDSRTVSQAVYAKVLDQGSGQCVIGVDGNVMTGRTLGADGTQSTMTPKLSGAEMTKTQGQSFYSYRNSGPSQYAKPNTQSYQDQNCGIYMVMRQGAAQFPGERLYQAEPGKVIPQSSSNSVYAQQSLLSENSVNSNEQISHITASNQSSTYAQQYPKHGQSGMNVYQAHKVDQSTANANHEHLPKSGPIGPSLIYQQHTSTPQLNGTSNFYTGGNQNREIMHYNTKESKSGCDRVDDIGKEVYSSNEDTMQVGDYGCKEDNSGKKAVMNRDDKGGKESRSTGFRKSKFGSSGLGSGSGQSSDYDKTNVDSGRGSVVSAQQIQRDLAETSEESSTTQQGNDSEWVDMVESELRQILEPHPHHQSASVSHGGGGNNSTISDSISSMTPPLPPLSPGEGNTTRYKLSQNASGVYGIKQDYGPIDGRKTSQSQGRSTMPSRFNWGKTSDRHKNMIGGSVTDITSTTGTGLDSLLDDDMTTSIATGDARAIRHQLEGLENMYSQVLQLLGVKRQGMKTQGYQPSDPRFSKRRFHGSMSSVPSSVSSRPIRDKRRQEERKKVKDIKGINKRFQRLESHVVTLARSVAHLSSEMRTQHLMIQEMENIRSELSALRTHTIASTNRSQSMPRLTAGVSSLPALTNPTRVKKLTKFFGDEPPLLRLFLKKLGYEKYASVFESERVGMVELPYMSEERLQSMGIPLGPRLRILQEAHVSLLNTDQLCVL